MKQKENKRSKESEWTVAVYKAPVKPVVQEDLSHIELPKKAKAVFSPSSRQSGETSLLESRCILQSRILVDSSCHSKLDFFEILQQGRWCTTPHCSTVLKAWTNKSNKEEQRIDEWPFHACCGGKQVFYRGERSNLSAQTVDVVVPTEIGGQSNT